MSVDTNNFIKFVREIYQTEDFIPLHEPRFIGNEKQYVNDAIDSTFVSSVGEYVNRFEKEFAEYVGSKFAVATVNGTAALHVSLLVGGVQPEDEVITQPLTFIATCNAISYCVAKPVFVDVDLDTLGLSPDSFRKFLEENSIQKSGNCINKITGKRISACVPMHTLGHPCRIDEIKKICDEFNIALIEDAAEALGSYYQNNHLGNRGKLSAFSFNGNKIITTGGGGMITTNYEELAKKCKHITTTAKIPHSWEFNHDQIAYNYRMPNLNAALGCAQLENLDDFIDKKRSLADKYHHHFDNLLKEPKGSKSNYWLNAVVTNSEKEQQIFLKETNSAGVMTRPLWTLMNELPMFKNCQISELPNSKKLASTVVNIPSSVPI
ncbi:MAG: LegC family aminotransferase [Lentisphaeraceae bacterium]|nr:LegC family aminotransferase [Lentisphaeraceae bacterium]